MKMRAKVFIRGNGFHKLLRTDGGAHGAHAYPQDSRHLTDSADQFRKAVFLLITVRGHIDAGQHHLLDAALCKAPDLAEYLRKLPASLPASCIRNDTVGAKGVTAVLHLHIGSGLFERRR